MENLTVKIKGLAPMSEFESEVEVEEYKDFIESDYSLSVLEQGDINEEEGYIIVKGMRDNIDDLLVEVMGFDWEDVDVEIIN